MSRQKGDIAEKIALNFLEEKNFKIVEKNFYAKKLGEIDIIAVENNTYHFIEVKSALEYEIAVNNISLSKLSKIKKSVEYYIQSKKINNPYCIDGLIVINNEIHHLENITF